MPQDTTNSIKVLKDKYIVTVYIRSQAHQQHLNVLQRNLMQNKASYHKELTLANNKHLLELLIIIVIIIIIM